MKRTTSAPVENIIEPQKLIGKSVTLPGQRFVELYPLGDGWHVVFKRPASSDDATPVATCVSLSDEALSALVQLYVGMAARSGIALAI